jgi:uncharacterized protein YjbJ (UPF0337 family)
LREGTHRKIEEILIMDTNRSSGTARSVGGKVEEGVGKTLGDVTKEIEDKAEQAIGAAQDLYDQAKHTASDAVEAAKQGASDVEDFVRSTIEQRPYTVAVAALCIGWLIGRASHHRRD